jgi:hypothetical protein
MPWLVHRPKPVAWRVIAHLPPPLPVLIPGSVAEFIPVHGHFPGRVPPRGVGAVFLSSADYTVSLPVPVRRR